MNGYDERMDELPPEDDSCYQIEAFGSPCPLARSLVRHLRNVTALIAAPDLTAKHRDQWLDAADEALQEYVRRYGDV